MAAHVRIGADLPEGAVPVRRIGASSRGAFELLRVAFVLIPVGAGLDKFSNFLCDWTRYLAPAVLDHSPLSASSLLYLIGFIEVFCGFLIIAAPRVGALALAGWITLVIGNLALLGEHWDVALRDFGLVLGALALAQLSRAHDEVEFAVPRRRLRRAAPEVTRMPRTDTLTSPSEG